MEERRLAWLLKEARARVHATSALLGHPRTCKVDECVTLLREAQGYLEWLRDEMRTDRRETTQLRAQASSLASEIRRAGTLLEGAARMGRRWLERMTAGYAGYTAAGGMTRPPITGHVSILG